MYHLDSDGGRAGHGLHRLGGRPTRLGVLPQLQDLFSQSRSVGGAPPPRSGDELGWRQITRTTSKFGD